MVIKRAVIFLMDVSLRRGWFSKLAAELVILFILK